MSKINEYPSLATPRYDDSILLVKDPASATPSTRIATAAGLMGAGEIINTQATASGATTLNLANGTVFDITLTAAITLTFSGTLSGAAYSFTLITRQGGSGSYSIGWPGTVKWSPITPTISTAVGAVDIYSFITVNNGATWFGNQAGKGYA